MKAKRGFSLLELLIAIAIIGILMAMYSGVLSKAMRAAKATAGNEAMRQRGIGRAADNANSIYRPNKYEGDRVYARAAFRRLVDTGKGETLISEMLHVVENDAEFSAYWHTLIDPDATFPIEYANDGSLVAVGPGGKRYTLPPIDEGLRRGVHNFPVMWDFLSTDMSEMSSGTLGVNVLYRDAHVEFIRYPGSFPATRVVAKLGHRFVQGE